MDNEMNYGEDYKYIPTTSVASNIGKEVLPDVYMYTVQIANIFLIGNQENFVLIDAGLPESGEEIVSVIEERFGGTAPKAVILTHGHFDHVGGIIEVIEKWDVPVFAHEGELPFLTGQKDYPEPDATVEGGMIAKMSPMFPNAAIDLGTQVRALPSDGSVPYMDGWTWLHTPGHAPGHISLFRESDRTLIAGDAFVTVRQDKLYKVLIQEREINGPPRYLTTDWDAAEASVRNLAELRPEIAVTGHGPAIAGVALTEGLQHLVENFVDIAIPDHGEYVDDTDKH